MNRKEAVNFLINLGDLVDKTKGSPDFLDSDKTLRKLEKALKILTKKEDLSRQEVWSIICMVNLVGDGLDGFWSIISTLIEYDPAWPFNEEQLLLLPSNNDYMDELKYMAIFTGGKVIHSRSLNAIIEEVDDKIELYQDSIDLYLLNSDEARYILFSLGNRISSEDITAIDINAKLNQRIRELITDIKLTSIEIDGLALLL